MNSPLICEKMYFKITLPDLFGALVSQTKFNNVNHSPLSGDVG
jgi:hypothetical protein